MLVADKDFSFTYSITTELAPGLTWASRMDHYTKITSHYEDVYVAQMAVMLMILFVCSIVVCQFFQWTIWKDSKILAKIEEKAEKLNRTRAMKVVSKLTLVSAVENEDDNDDRRYSSITNDETISTEPS